MYVTNKWLLEYECSRDMHPAPTHYQNIVFDIALNTLEIEEKHIQENCQSRDLDDTVTTMHKIAMNYFNKYRHVHPRSTKLEIDNDVARILIGDIERVIVFTVGNTTKQELINYMRQDFYERKAHYLALMDAHEKGIL